MTDEYLSEKLQSLIYDNEGLLVEVERLKEKLKIIGADDLPLVKHERDELQQKVQLLTTQLSERNEQKKMVDSFQGALATNFNLSNGKIKEISKEVETSLQNMRSVIVEKDEKIEQLQTTIKGNVLQKHSLSTQLASVETENKKKGNELNSLRVELEAIRKERDELLLSTSETKGAVDVLQKQVDQLLSDHDSLMCENEELRRVAKGSPLREVSLESAEVQQYVASQVAKATSATENKWKVCMTENEHLRKEIEALKKTIAAFPASPAAGTPSLSPPSRGTVQSSKASIINEKTPTQRMTKEKINEIICNGNYNTLELCEMVQSFMDTHEKMVDDLKSELAAQGLSFNDKEAAYLAHIKRLEEENKTLEAKQRAAVNLSSFSFPSSASTSQNVGDGFHRPSFFIPAEDTSCSPFAHQVGGNAADTYPAFALHGSDTLSPLPSSREDLPPRIVNDTKTFPRAHRGSVVGQDESHSASTLQNCPHCTFQQPSSHITCSACGRNLRG